MSPTGTGTSTGAGRSATLHYTANGNFGPSGQYLPGPLGFDLADVGSRGQLDGLPAAIRGLAYVGSCAGADAQFTAAIDAYTGDPRLFGVYLVDEPDPATCPPANLAAESGYVHSRLPGVRTFVLLQNLASSRAPRLPAGYAPAHTGVDLFGLDPYPCRSETGGCELSMIDRYVSAARNAGIPAGSIVPVFQAFGGGSWRDDGSGAYQLPTPAQEQAMIARWAQLVPRPVFDYAYSWGQQRGDTSLAAEPALQQVFAAHNR